jgi:hypothetical protein
VLDVDVRAPSTAFLMICCSKRSLATPTSAGSCSTSNGGSEPPCRCQTGRSGEGNPAGGVLRSRRCWPTCSCTMRSTFGWSENSRAVDLHLRHLLGSRVTCPAGPTEITTLKDVLEANSSRCREGPRISLTNGLSRTKESRAWPGTHRFSSVAAASAMGV